MVLGGYRYSTPPGPPGYPYPGYTSPPDVTYADTPRGQSARLKDAVGLKSVDQLSLSDHFSEFRGITEGYNLVKAGKSNNHFVIPGTK